MTAAAQLCPVLQAKHILSTLASQWSQYNGKAPSVGQFYSSPLVNGRTHTHTHIHTHTHTRTNYKATANYRTLFSLCVINPHHVRFLWSYTETGSLLHFILCVSDW